jgi:hypothetical protein
LSRQAALLDLRNYLGDGKMGLPIQRNP